MKRTSIYYTIALLTVSGCRSLDPLTPVRITVDAHEKITLNGNTVSPRDLTHRLRDRQRRPADYFPVILTGFEEVTGKQIDPAMRSLAEGFVIDVWFECRTPGTNILVKTELPVPDGRRNDLDLVVSSTVDGRKEGACSIYYESGGVRTSETVRLSKLSDLLSEVARTRSIQLNGVRHQIKKSEAWVQDGDNRTVRQLHPLVGISWHPETCMKHVADVLQICSVLGFGEFIPLQINQPTEIEVKDGQQVPARYHDSAPKHENAVRLNK
jgi:hypothetical protein